MPEAPPLAPAAALLDGADAPVPARDRFGAFGRSRVVYGRTTCAAGGRGGVLVHPDPKARPTVGRPLRVVWTTTPTAPYVEPVACYLLVSFGDVAPTQLVGVGLDGCTLHVDGNARNRYSLTPAPGSILTAQGGRITLEWAPPASFAGVELNLQLLVYAPGASRTGWTLSPGLELWIGSGD